MNRYSAFDDELPRPCNAVDERDSGTWECVNNDCYGGGHWFRRIDTANEGNPA